MGEMVSFIKAMHHSTALLHTITKSNLNDYTLSTGATYLYFTYNSMIKDRHKQESTPLGLHSRNGISSCARNYECSS